MGKQVKPKKPGKPVVSDGLDEIDPAIVYFTHSKIRPVFSGCGRRIQDTIEEITGGLKTVADVPFITILTSGDGHYYSLNNRRLYVLKYLRANGFLEPSNTVRARFKAPLPREVKKYSPENCSLTATIMKERPVRDVIGADEKADSAGEYEECEERTAPCSSPASHAVAVSISDEKATLSKTDISKECIA